VDRRRVRIDPNHLKHPAVLLFTFIFLVGCAPNPQQVQSAELLVKLVGARGMFMEVPPRAQTACDAVGDVQTRLNYEPGLSDVRPAWAALSQAAEALQAVCGQSNLLDEPALETPPMTQARERWQLSIQREIGVACDHLRAAATALNRATPC
jgi:hypothetical protein